MGPVENDAAGGPVSDAAEVDIGGIPANVLYRGRSSYVGLDQINVQVPAGVSGCNVSVVVVTGSYVSNFATILDRVYRPHMRGRHKSPAGIHPGGYRPVG